MKIPNVFIVGAPKSGTTTLCDLLAEHGNVFFPTSRVAKWTNTGKLESNFFAEDLPGCRFVESIEDYLDLYADCAEDTRLVGDASVHHLHSTVAISRILELSPDAKMIAILRNPVDLAYSWYRELVFSGSEDAQSFLEAWSLQECRKAGQRRPESCREPELLQYRRIGALGTQVQRLMSIAPGDQVAVLLLDDLRDKPELVCGQLSRFLGCNELAAARVTRRNPTKSYRWPKLRGLAKAQTGPIKDLKTQWSRALPRTYGFLQAGFELINRGLNVRQGQDPGLSEVGRRFLVSQFESEVRLLEDLLNRDLGVWLTDV